MGGQEKACLGCISEIMRCRMLMLGVTCDLAVVTLIFKLLCGLYLGNHKVWKVET